MDKPGRMKTFLLSLIGQSWAYDSVEDVAEVIGMNAFDAHEGRVATHRRGAASLTDALALQPGLVDLHDEMNDTWHYLTALKARADALGCASLADNLENAASGVRDVLQQVAGAAEATVPQPSAPARQ
ncbi:hypothetical protein OG413_46720 [Streptomyces sp. NBC_01433]|uniref:hypothetical protein n=1 Tax=Streptomyces sp. NBC_01433 TaxID=2903864 RepID=UPI0022569814|nr:hypothetical protein [Streptomyces sp. NBC_01433]MCX4682643.1 hypothetical protein [Streptomyces sp. NBC_01433]MCX4682683.1 hypothetical protein [Streptomyces sp. NBC_01433]